MKKNEIIPYNPKLKIPARELRNNSTKSEIIIWNKIKKNIPPTPFEGGGRGEPRSVSDVVPQSGR